MTDPFAAAPTGLSATVTRADGTALAAPTVTTEGLRAVIALTNTHASALDRLAVSVTAMVAGSTAVQRFVVDVVDADYFPIAAVRMEPGLSDSGRFPDPLIADHRDGLIDYVEKAARRAFVPRFDIEQRIGNGHRTLPLGFIDVSSIRRAVVDGTEVTDATVVSGCMAQRPGGWPRGRSIVLHLEHGMAAPPGRLVTEMLRCLRRDLLARGAQAPSDTIWETVEGNTVRYSTPDFAAGRPTGVLGLDALINGYRASVGIA